MPSITAARAFRLAVGVVALHVLDDNFVQPQPGTSAGDHLVSGLVPLAALALAAWAYPRLRDGGRGALALIVGMFGIVAGVEAVRYTIQVGPSGDDYTGCSRSPRASRCSDSASRRCGGPAAGTTAARGATCADRCSARPVPSSPCSWSRR